MSVNPNQTNANPETTFYGGGGGGGSITITTSDSNAYTGNSFTFGTTVPSPTGQLKQVYFYDTGSGTIQGIVSAAAAPTYDVNITASGSNTVNSQSSNFFAKSTVSGLPAGSNILVQGTAGAISITGSNVTGYVQIGIGFSDNVSGVIYSDPIWIDTNYPYSFSNVRICGVLANTSTTNEFVMLGSNATGANLLMAGNFAQLKMTPLN